VSEVAQFINNVGFPIAVAVGIGLALWKIGTRLTDAHVKYLNSTTEAISKQTETLAVIKDTLPKICQADCGAARNCANYKLKENECAVVSTSRSSGPAVAG
jgi:hypothetical protein